MVVENVLIGYPDYIDKRPGDFADLVEFFNRLSDQLILRKLEYEFVGGSGMLSPPESDKVIALSYHTMLQAPNVWNVSKALLDGYVCLDRLGYSGGSWISQVVDYGALLEGIDDGEAVSWFESFRSSYILSGRSKWLQQKWPLRIEGPYVFLVGQVHADTAMRYAHMPLSDLIVWVSEHFSGTGYKIVYKPHPYDDSPSLNIVVDEMLRRHKHFVVSKASVHDIISGSSLVITVNSAVGLEAMLHSVPVAVAGQCEYATCAWELWSKDDLPKLGVNFGFRRTPEYIAKYIFWLCNRYWIDTKSSTALGQWIDNNLGIRPI